MKKNINRNIYKSRNEKNPSGTNAILIFCMFLILSSIAFLSSYIITTSYIVKKQNTFTLPSFFGLSLEDTVLKLQNMGLYMQLELSSDPRQNLNDKIISQSPQQGTKVSPGTKVKILLAKSNKDVHE